MQSQYRVKYVGGIESVLLGQVYADYRCTLVQVRLYRSFEFISLYISVRFWVNLDIFSIIYIDLSQK